MTNKEPFRKINTLKGHKDVVDKFSWSPHEDALASTSHDRTTIIWQNATQDNNSKEEFKNMGPFVWDVNEYGILLYEPSDSSIYRQPHQGFREPILTGIKLFGSDFWPSFDLIAYQPDDRLLKIIDLNRRNKPYNIVIDAKVNSLAWKPNEQKFAVSNSNGHIRLYEKITDNNPMVRRSNSSDIIKLQWHPDGTSLASTWRDNSFKIWEEDLRGSFLDSSKKNIYARSFSYSPDGLIFIARCDDSKIRIWRTDNWDLIETLDDLFGGFHSIMEFHPKQLLVATIADDDTEIDIWEYDSIAILENAERSKNQAKVDLAEQFGASPADIKILKESAQKKIITKKTKTKKTTKQKIEKKKAVKKATPDKVPPKPKIEKEEVTPVSVQLAIRAISDKPIENANEDLLNYSVYAKALSEFIMLKDTETPLTIAIDAPWGRGKSSIMNLMKSELEDYGLITVWFNAWRYEKAENLWAALALQVMETLNKRLDFKERIEFNLSILRDRFNEENLKNDPFGLLKKGIPLLLSLLSKTFIGSIAPIKLNLNQLLPGPDYRQRAGFLNSFQKDFKIIIQNMKKFETNRIDSNKGHPRNIEKADKGRIVIFIDDLDRCPPPKPVEIIEAINVILDVENCVFVLGIDLDMICASIETKYKSLRDYFINADENRDPRIGQRFMEKIVELNFRIPPPDGTEIENLYDSFMVKEEHPEEPSKKTGSTQEKTQSETASKLDKQKHYEEVNKVVEELKRQMDKTKPISDAVKEYKQTKTVVDGFVLSDAAYYIVSEKQNIDNKLFRDAITIVAREMEPNPRKIKRFVNIFKMKATVAELKSKLDDTLNIDKLAQWTYLYMDWPDLGKATIENPDVLVYLIKFAQEKPPSELPAVKNELTAKYPSLTNKLSEWENDTDLIKFLKSLKKFNKNLLEKLKSF